MTIDCDYGTYKLKTRNDYVLSCDNKDTYMGKITSQWPIVETEDMASSEVSVNVIVDDNGIEYHTVFCSGVGGLKVVNDMPMSSWSLSLAEETSSPPKHIQE